MQFFPTKYLGLLLSANLSFSEHIQLMCMKARKILGRLYRRFYNNSDGSTLLQLYLSLVRQYASPVWNPHMQKDIKLLENVEKFAIRMISYQKMGLWISRTFRHGCSSIPRVSWKVTQVVNDLVQHTQTGL